MQRSTGIGMKVPPNFDPQQVEDVVRQKLAIEPTDVVSSDEVFLQCLPTMKKPKKDKDDKKKKSPKKKKSTKKPGEKRPGKSK